MCVWERLPTQYILYKIFHIFMFWLLAWYDDTLCSQYFLNSSSRACFFPDFPIKTSERNCLQCVLMQHTANLLRLLVKQAYFKIEFYIVWNIKHLTSLSLCSKSTDIEMFLFSLILQLGCISWYPKWVFLVHACNQVIGLLACAKAQMYYGKSEYTKNVF